MNLFKKITLTISLVCTILVGVISYSPNKAYALPGDITEAHTTQEWISLLTFYGIAQTNACIEAITQGIADSVIASALIDWWNSLTTTSSTDIILNPYDYDIDYDDWDFGDGGNKYENFLNDYSTNLTYNGGNKSYYYNNDNTSNYSVVNYNNNQKYDIKYITNNNQTYNYNDIDYITYNITNNEYKYYVTNNNYISISNTYNNVTIINGNDTYTLYYKLPNGLNSLNMSLDMAINGIKSSLSVGTYNTYINDSNLKALYHFDSDEYDSSNGNTELSIIPNSIQYIGVDDSFKNALVLNSNTNISLTNSSNLYYSFRIYPLLSDNLNININNTNLGNFDKNYNTSFNYNEYTNNTLTSESGWTTYIKTTINGQSYIGFLFNGCALLYTYDYLLNHLGEMVYDSMALRYYKIDLLSSYINTEFNYKTKTETINLVSLNGRTYSNYQLTYSTKADSERITKYYSNSMTTNRTYNFINDSYYESTQLCNYLNPNMWNYVYISNSGNIYVNGINTNISIPVNENLNIQFTGNSTIYIDELAITNNSRSSISPVLPYDTNIVYTIPNDPINNQLLLQTTIPVNSYKFGGVKNVNSTTGDCYISIDDYGYITSCQIYNGIEYISIKGAIYNKKIGLWVSAIGFNIYNNNWNYVEEEFTTDNNDTNLLIRFFKSLKTDIINAINNVSIVNNISNVTNNNYESDYNVNSVSTINNQITNINNADSNITFKNDSTTLPQISNNVNTLVGTFNSVLNVFTNNNLGFYIYIPIALMILCLII